MWWDGMATKGQFHSHAVGHGMRWAEMAWQRKEGSFTHMLLVMGWDVMRWQIKRAVLLTCCWSWDEMWWDGIAEKKGSVTHSLLVMDWDVMRWHGKKKGSFTHMLWDETWWDGIVNKRAMLLTCCWSWDEMDEMAWTVSLTSCWSWDDRYDDRKKWAVSLTCCWS